MTIYLLVADPVNRPAPRSIWQSQVELPKDFVKLFVSSPRMGAWTISSEQWRLS